MALEKEGPIEDKMRRVMNDIGQIIARTIKERGENYGFALLVFPMGEAQAGDRMNYISNAHRGDMIVAMKEFIAKAEGRYDDGAEKQRRA